MLHASRLRRRALGAAVLLGAMAALLLSGNALLAKPLLKAGDRMVFLGDSITEQRLHTRYVMNYFALRYPDAKITFRNAGWSGDTASGGLERLDRDVLSLKPDVVSICFGMNDGHALPFRMDNYKAFMDGMTGLIRRLKAAGVQVVLLTPGCVDPYRKSWLAPEKLSVYNSTLVHFARGARLLAARENVPIYDIYTLMLDVQRRAQADDPAFTMIPDGVHPSPPGQAIMAYGMLKALGCDEQPSSLTIAADKARATTDRCSVSGLRVCADSVSFTRTDDALPAYFPPEAEVIFKYCPIPDELNRYMFKVTGLKPGTWKLTVGGAEVGSFSAEALASGVNLSVYDGPWKKLGAQVSDLCSQQENLYFTRWREVSLKTPPPEGLAEQTAKLADLDRQIAEKEAARAKAVSQRTWRWSLTLAQ